MKHRYSRGLAAVLASLMLVGIGAFVIGQKASAAGDGKITGTVKLDGAAPHMKGIDMSKDPWCTKQNAADPVHLQLVEVGKNGGLENVVLYISQGLSGDAASAKPTALPRPCPSGPVVVSMPLAWPCSGWPATRSADGGTTTDNRPNCRRRADSNVGQPVALRLVSPRLVSPQCCTSRPGADRRWPSPARRDDRRRWRIRRPWWRP